MERCEALVIGLGAMGAATVYQLAKAGVNVVGIDRHHPPHTFGSSHGDTRITRLSVGEGAQYVPIVRNSHRIWRELEALSGEALFEQTGLLVLTSSPDFDPADETDFTLRTIALAQIYGIEHEVLDAAQIRQRFPQFAQVRDDAIGAFGEFAPWVSATDELASRLSNLHIHRSLDVYECTNCGRLWLQKVAGNQFVSYVPEEGGYHAILSATSGDSESLDCE
ncbi:FAD-dependent oxidoreductase [Pseudomonas sp. MCal1]|nr:FAD-dependent oxidoreductase [Pseudomonas sp. MCal1]